jgi:hypothetical protein
MKTRLSKLGFLFAILLLIALKAQAQLQLAPLQSDLVRKELSQTQTSTEINGNKIQALLDLPFFDDFSSYTGSPDPLRWESSGGTYVNRRYAQAPASVGVVTFDGLQANGDAYFFGNVINQPCDSLISKPFRMSTFGPGDSVYLTFFWQPEGNGEAPNASEGDSIYLLFKTNIDTWVPKWGITGRRTQPFRHAAILVDDVSFFYDGFQFMFISAGNPTGAYDTWNLDYITLSAGRTLTDSTYNDLSISEQQGRLLSKFTRMPLDHFMVNPANQLSDSLVVLVNNLDNTNLNFTFRSAVLGSGACSFSDTALLVNGNIPNRTYGQAVGIAINKDTLAQLAASFCSWKTIHFFDSIAVINTRIINDTISEQTDFADEFAYDDGSAEYGLGIVNAINGRFAVRFEVPKSDTLGQVKMNWVRLGRNAENQNLELFIWRNLSNDTADILHRQTITIQYTDSLNGFVTYNLTKPVPVGTTFHVGWLQFSTEFLNLGADLNNNFNNRMFFNTNGVWQAANLPKGVAPMLRPVLYDPTAVGFEDEILTTEKIRVFPNPAMDRVNIKGEFRKGKLAGMDGRTLISFEKKEEEVMLDLSDLPIGFYMLIFETSNNYVYQKLIKQ